MTVNETINLFESLIPAIIGGALGLFALAGLREFLKEAKLALKSN